MSDYYNPESGYNYLIGAITQIAKELHDDNAPLSHRLLGAISSADRYARHNPDAGDSWERLRNTTLEEVIK